MSALSRPENAYHCSDPKPDAAELAAAYGFGFAKNNPFNDANKRTALIAMRLFLKINGYYLAASPTDKYKTIIRVAASDIIEDEPEQKIRKNLKEIKSKTCVIVFNVRWLGGPMCVGSGPQLQSHQ